jgi:hypothetical protein
LKKAAILQDLFWYFIISTILVELEIFDIVLIQFPPCIFATMLFVLAQIPNLTTARTTINAAFIFRAVRTSFLLNFTKVVHKFVDYLSM